MHISTQCRESTFSLSRGLMNQDWRRWLIFLFCVYFTFNIHPSCNSCTIFFPFHIRALLTWLCVCVCVVWTYECVCPSCVWRAHTHRQMKTRDVDPRSVCVWMPRVFVSASNWQLNYPPSINWVCTHVRSLWGRKENKNTRDRERKHPSHHNLFPRVASWHRGRLRQNISERSRRI